MEDKVEMCCVLVNGVCRERSTIEIWMYLGISCTFYPFFFHLGSLRFIPSFVSVLSFGAGSSFSLLLASGVRERREDSSDSSHLNPGTRRAYGNPRSRTFQPVFRRDEDK